MVLYLFTWLGPRGNMEHVKAPPWFKTPRGEVYWWGKWNCWVGLPKYNLIFEEIIWLLLAFVCLKKVFRDILLYHNNERFERFTVHRWLWLIVNKIRMNLKLIYFCIIFMIVITYLLHICGFNMEVFAVASSPPEAQDRYEWLFSNFSVYVCEYKSMFRLEFSSTNSLTDHKTEGVLFGIQNHYIIIKSFKL